MRLLISEFGSKESATPAMKLINRIALEVPPNLTEAKENLEKTYRTFSEYLLALSDNRLLMPVCGNVHIWSLLDGRHLATLETDELAAHFFNPDCLLELPENRLALGNFDSIQEEVHIWDLKNGNCITKPKVTITTDAPYPSFPCYIVSLFGDYFVTYRPSTSGHCAIWSKTTGKLLHKLPDVIGVIPLKDNFFVTWQPGRYMLPELWALEREKCSKVRSLPIKATIPVKSVVLPNNSIAFVGVSSSIFIMNVPIGSESTMESNLSVWDSKSDNCDIIYTAKSRPTSKISPLQRMQRNSPSLSNPRLSSSGQYLVFDDGLEVIIWDIVNNKLLPHIAPNTEGGLSIRVLPYDLIATDDSLHFKIWDLKTGQCLTNLTLRTTYPVSPLLKILNIHFFSDKFFLAGYYSDGSIPYIYQFNSLDTLLQVIESACTSKKEPRYFVSKSKEEQKTVTELQKVTFPTIPSPAKASVKIEEQASLRLPTLEEITRSFPVSPKPLLSPADDDDTEWSSDDDSSDPLKAREKIQLPQAPVPPSIETKAVVARQKQEQKDHRKGDEDLSFSVSFAISYSELKLSDELGRGGFGVVHKGIWRGTPVAIKQLLAATFSKETVDEFSRESAIMARLRNPNVVQFYGYCPSPHYCLVMEYMPKGSLYTLLHSDHPLDSSLKYRLVVDIANGLTFLHASNILHRDLKSLNILLNEHFQAKLSDFGLSKVKSETRNTNTKGKAIGTPAWMAPESMKREPEFTKKSDIYSFAMVVWEIYSRKLPFADAAQPYLIINWVLQGDRERIPADCPKKIASLIARCWMGNPKDRPDIEEVVSYLKSDKEEFMSVAAAISSNPASTADSIIGNLESGIASVRYNLSS